MISSRSIHHGYPSAHCASICKAHNHVWVSYYRGPECSDQQAIEIQCWHDNDLITTLMLPERTGNSILMPYGKGVRIIMSQFTDSNGYRKGAARWSDCINLTGRLWLEEKTIKHGRFTKIPFRPQTGFLVRCNPIKHANKWYLPYYREVDCYGGVISSEDGVRWNICGNIGYITDIKSGRFGQGILMQPTLWHDGTYMHSLSRDVTMYGSYSRSRAWYSYSDNDGETWSDPISSKLWNDCNSIMVAHDGTANPFVIWNHGKGRSQLLLGRWSQDNLDASKLLQLNEEYNASYPNCWYDRYGLYIVHTEGKSITRHYFTKSTLSEIERISIERHRTLTIFNLRDIGLYV